VQLASPEKELLLRSGTGHFRNSRGSRAGVWVMLTLWSCVGTTNREDLWETFAAGALSPGSCGCLALLGSLTFVLSQKKI